MTRRAHAAAPRRQAGATMIIALIMIAIITLIVVNAFNMSSSNLKAVGNMQMREEAVSAANEVIEQLVSSAFYTSTADQEVLVDINKDGNRDFRVNVLRPVCKRAWVAAAVDPSDVELPNMNNGSVWYTEWDLDATATDMLSGSGVSVRVHQGVRVPLPEAQKVQFCGA
jgi:hypothetical protein